MKLLLAAAVTATILAARVDGLRWNGTPSMPVGLWRLQAMEAPVQRGEIVALCLPEATARFGRERGYLDGGACPGGTEVLIKPVAAVPGDRVGIAGDGISVNGKPVSNSRPLSRDEAGRQLTAQPSGTRTVAPGEVWIISGHDPRSYDSRYYGPVDATGIRGVALPVLTIPLENYNRASQ